jgi:plastocyanin
MMTIIVRSIILSAFALPVLAGLALQTVAQAQSPSEQREVGPFTKIDIDRAGHAVITVGDTESLTITAPQQYLDRIRAEVDDETLEIDFEGREGISLDRRDEIRYDITVRSLDGIELDGAASAEADGLTGESLEIDLEGAASLIFANISYSTLEIELEDATSATLSGSVDRQSIEMRGAASYDALELDSATAEVRLNQAASAQIRVSESITGEVDGAASLDYIGEATTVDVRVRAAGSVTQLPFIPIDTEGAATPAATPAATDAAEAPTVTMRDRIFAPATVEIAAGTTVTWSNNDDSPHTVTSVDNLFDSGVIDEGGSFTFTFDEAGTYDYFCAIHPEMTGTIIVS